MVLGRETEDCYNWEKMKNLLCLKFLLKHYRHKVFINYHNIKQNGLLVKEFTINQFDRLKMRCDVAEEDEQTIAKYIIGLQNEI